MLNNTALVCNVLLTLVMLENARTPQAPVLNSRNTLYQRMAESAVPSQFDHWRFV